MKELDIIHKRRDLYNQYVKEARAKMLSMMRKRHAFLT